MLHGAGTHKRWLYSAVLPAVVLSAAGLVLSPSAAAKFGSNEPCVASNGLTLALVYRAPASIVSPACNQLRAGERWVPSVPWIMNIGFDHVPPGFASPWGTPLADFRGKLKAVEYVVDPGSAGSYNISYPKDALWVGELPEAPGLPAVNTVGIGALNPLPTGQHVVDVYWDFSSQHCDGFGTSPAADCLPGGQSLARRITFNVVAPQPVT